MGKYEDRQWSGQKGKKFGHVGRTEDPYQPEEGQEAALCTTCQAIYQNKRWFFDENLAGKLAGTDKVKEVTCPTCRKVKDRYSEGILTLSGDFFKEHKDEIVNLLKKEAERVGKRSVPDRIITMTEEAQRPPGGGDHHREAGPAPGPGRVQGLQGRTALQMGGNGQACPGLLVKIMYYRGRGRGSLVLSPTCPSHFSFTAAK